jgi:hypothetical protein
MSMNRVYGPFSTERNITHTVYLDTLQNIFISQYDQDYQEGSIFFQQYGAHFHELVRLHLNTRFPNRWVGRAGQRSSPPPSPDVTPLDLS